MSGKNPPVMKSTRRSTRRRGQGQDPVVAPGFGTKKDIMKLSQDLSVGGDAKLPAAAVEGTCAAKIALQKQNVPLLTD